MKNLKPEFEKIKTDVDGKRITLAKIELKPAPRP